MRAKERAQNVGAGYSSGRKELPAREAGLVCAPESALPSWGCDRGWRAGAMLRSRSTQEMDGGENKVDEMKVARPPVFVNVHLGPSALVALLSRVALFGARNGWLRLGGAPPTPGSRRVATGRVLERLSPPPGEMFSPLYGTGRTSQPLRVREANLLGSAVGANRSVGVAVAAHAATRTGRVNSRWRFASFTHRN